MKIVFCVIAILFIVPIFFSTIFADNEIETFLQSAKVNDSIENYEGALKDFEQVLKLDPNNLQALNGKGGILLKLNNEESIVYIEKALEFDHEFVPALTNKGIWFVSQKNEIQALEYFNKALNIKPNDLNVLFNKANLLKLSEPEKSLQVLDEILISNPDNKRAIQEKTNLFSSMDIVRIDGYVQSVLRNENGQLIGYMESDVINKLDYTMVKDIVEGFTDFKQPVILNGQKYNNMIFGGKYIIKNDSIPMITSIEYIFGSTYPQNETIDFKILTGRTHGYLVESNDYVESIFQVIFLE